MFKLRLKQLWNAIKSIITPIAGDIYRAGLEVAKDDVKKEINALRQHNANKVLKK